MKRLFSIGTAALVSAATLVAGWQLSATGQGNVPGAGPADPDYARESYRPNPDDPAYADPGEHGVVLVPMNPAWETDFSKLQTILSTNPESLNPQQLQILEGGLKNRTESLTEQYAAAEDEARKKELKSELANIAGQHFAVLQAIREREIANIEQQVARLRGLLQQREDAREQIVGARVDQLVRSATGLGWDGSEREPGTLPPVRGVETRRRPAPQTPAAAPISEEAPGKFGAGMPYKVRTFLEEDGGMPSETPSVVEPEKK